MLFDNIGRKLQTLAKILFVVGIIASIVYALILFRASFGNDALVLGVLVLVGGILGSLISSWLLHGFGEIVENSEKNTYYLCELEKSVEKMKDHNHH